MDYLRDQDFSRLILINQEINRFLSNYDTHSIEKQASYLVTVGVLINFVSLLVIQQKLKRQNTNNYYHHALKNKIKFVLALMKIFVSRNDKIQNEFQGI